MRAQIRGLNRASMNAQDGISMIQAAEGALQESHNILQKMRELAMQGASGVPASEDRDAILAELESLAEELERIASTTNFNGKYILSGAYGGAQQEDFGGIQIRESNIPNAMIANELEEPTVINLQVGANTNLGDVITVAILGVSRMDLLGGDDWWGGFGAFKGEDAGDTGFNEALRRDDSTGNINAEDDGRDAAAVPVDDQNWQTLINILDGNLSTEGEALEGPHQYTGLSRVSFLRSELGAVQNRLEHTVANVDTVAENMQAAEARIRDVDMAKEMMSFTKNSILNQAATAMLAQANQSPQTVLQLLQ
jgi:flagellin